MVDDVPESVGVVLAHLERLSVMAVPEFDLTPPEPILYLCRWCIDAGPEHLDKGEHTCQKAWSYTVGGDRKCQCPCGEVYAGMNRLLIYCKVMRTHARIADDAMRRARKDARSERQSRRYYQSGYYEMARRQEAWEESERTIAKLKEGNNYLDRQVDALNRRLARAEQDRDIAIGDVISQVRVNVDYKKKADEYDKLMKPMETNTRRHIILDDES